MALAALYLGASRTCSVPFPSRGSFILPCEIRKIHDALKLASRLKTNGWPVEEEPEGESPKEPEILNLWFDLAAQKWIWLRPDSMLEDELGLACAQFTKDELEQDVACVALKLLFPAKQPFFSVKGDVFEPTTAHSSSPTRLFLLFLIIARLPSLWWQPCLSIPVAGAGGD